jgi:hypothetical protein
VININLQDVLRVLEQQFPKELTIAVQQVKIQMLEQQLQESEQVNEREV